MSTAYPTAGAEEPQDPSAASQPAAGPADAEARADDAMDTDAGSDADSDTDTGVDTDSGTDTGADSPAAPGRTAEATEVAPTGDPRVDAAVARLAELPDLPVTDHVEVYEDVHRRLQGALSDLAPDA